MTPRGPDGKFTPSTPQQKLAAHVERVNAAHPESIPTPNWDWHAAANNSYQDCLTANTYSPTREDGLAQQAPIGQEDWRAVNAAHYAKLDESLDDFSQAFGLDKPTRRLTYADVFKPKSHKDAFLWLGILASLTLVVLGWYLLAH